MNVIKVVNLCFGLSVKLKPKQMYFLISILTNKPY